MGDPILKDVRSRIRKLAADDMDLEFRLNRWIYSRFQQDEIRVKRPIKKALWDAGYKSCQSCGRSFETLKGLEIHRKRGRLGYSTENCVLVCRPCHEKLERPSQD